MAVFWDMIWPERALLFLYVVHGHSKSACSTSLCCMHVEGDAVTPSRQQALKKARRSEGLDLAEALQPQGIFQMPSGPPGSAPHFAFSPCENRQTSRISRGDRVAAFETYDVEYLLDSQIKHIYGLDHPMLEHMQANHAKSGVQCFSK